MTPPKNRVERIVPLAAAFAASDLTRLALSEGDFSVEFLRRTKQPLAQAAQPSEQIEPAAPESHKAATVTDNTLTVRSEMVGVVRFLDAKVAPGASVKPDRELCVIEALGVRTPVLAPAGGTIRDILVREGSPVEYGQALVVIERV